MIQINLSFGDTPDPYGVRINERDISLNTGHGDAIVHVWLPVPDAPQPPMYDKPTIKVNVSEGWDGESVELSPKECETLAFALMRAANYVRQYKAAVKA